jgi:hypothetical protein
VLGDRYWSIPTTTTPDLQAGLAAAREHWQAEPSCGTPAFRLIPSHLAIAGGVHWDHDGLCLIDIERGGHAFEDSCDLIVHEYGHLLGLGHGHPFNADSEWDADTAPDPEPFYDPALEGTVMDYRVLDTHGGVPACDRERDRRTRLENRWFDLDHVAAARRRLCRKLTRTRAATAPRRCQQAAATTRRARALRQRITWEAW